MASPAGVGAAVAGAAVVTLLSAALALYGPQLDAGTGPQATRRDGQRRGGSASPRTAVCWAGPVRGASGAELGARVAEGGRGERRRRPGWDF